MNTLKDKFKLNTVESIQVMKTLRKIMTLLLINLNCRNSRLLNKTSRQDLIMRVVSFISSATLNKNVQSLPYLQLQNAHQSTAHLTQNTKQIPFSPKASNIKKSSTFCRLAKRKNKTQWLPTGTKSVSFCLIAKQTDKTAKALLLTQSIGADAIHNSKI